MKQHKPNCATNIQCAVYHTNGICTHPKVCNCDFNDTSYPETHYKTTTKIEELCQHGVVEKYCYNCRFKEKYGMKIEMFNNHHYVRLKDVEQALLSQRKNLVERIKALKRTDETQMSDDHVYDEALQDIIKIIE